MLPHSEAARKAGYGITLHLDSQTRTLIDEFSTSGFLAIKPSPTGGKPTLVIPNSTSVIQSVTSASAAELARDVLGWNVETREVPWRELAEFSEVFAAGTAAGLLPIKSVEMKSESFEKVFCEGETPGPCYIQLSDLLKGIQRGLVEDTKGWCQMVEAPKE